MVHRSTTLVTVLALCGVVTLSLVAPASAQVHYHDDGQPWKQRANGSCPTGRESFDCRRLFQVSQQSRIGCRAGGTVRIAARQDVHSR